MISNRTLRTCLTLVASVAVALAGHGASAVTTTTLGPGNLSPLGLYYGGHYVILDGTTVIAPKQTGPPSLVLSGQSAIEMDFGSSVQINGGTFWGGSAEFVGNSNSLTQAFGGDGLRLGDATATIFGGDFRGGDATNLASIGSARAGRGISLGRAAVKIFGGTFEGGLRTNRFGSSVTTFKFPAIEAFNGHIELSGGVVNGYIDLVAGSTLLTHGSNLAFANSMLTGVFDNGQGFAIPVDGVGVRVVASSPTTLTLASVGAPEMSTFNLALVGLGLLFTLRRTRLSSE
jgi:hypothetical protein